MDTEGSTDDQILQRLTSLTEAVGEILLWAREVEKAGAVPKGTLHRARIALQREQVQERLASCREVLEALEGHDVPAIRRRLVSTIMTLEARAEVLAQEVQTNG